jgi:outer membrane protein assembly factor BamB
VRSNRVRDRVLLPVLGALSSLGLVTLGLGCSSESPSPTPSTRRAVPFEAGSPWPKFRGNARQDGRSDVIPAEGGASWDFRTAKGIFSSPVVSADGTIYVGSADRTFYALDAGGDVKWSVGAGEIIDSSALLDDRGRVYFGAGDGKLRALDARTGEPVWTFEAESPEETGGFINWFEGNVAMGPSGTLYVPNDNFRFYAIDRDLGSARWSFPMPDQTWSSPAIDTRTETLYVGNNNLLPFLGANTFAIDESGISQWSTRSLGTIAASPMLTHDDKLVVGGFDGYVRAYDLSGQLLWERGTRDHVYASPAELPDGTIVQPSCDGTIYGLDPTDGAVRWAFDTREPVRSSPAIDGLGNIYVGSGEGRLFVLGPDGTLRWAIRLIDEPRDDLNSSPALGRTAIYIAGESGQVFSVPYDYCLGPQGEGDERCYLGPDEDVPGDGAHLSFTSPLGALTSMPAEIDENQALTFSLLVRADGDTELALLDPASIEVTVEPPTDTVVAVAGDGRFVTVTPVEGWGGGAGGALSLHVRGDYLVDFEREGLVMSGGRRGGDLDERFDTVVRPREIRPMPLPVANTSGAAAGAWELYRLAIPTPTMMPSYNQIGFDSLHYLIGLVELDEAKGVAWMVGGRPGDGEGDALVDPATKALLPLAVRYEGGFLTLENGDGLSVEVMNAVIPFETFRLGARLDDGGDAADLATMSGSTVCGEVPFYGPFLEQLGLCNPNTDVLTVFGAANLRRHEDATAPAGLGAVAFSLEGDVARATVTGGALSLEEHVVALLLVDDATGLPVTLDYGLTTERKAAASGALEEVTIDVSPAALTGAVRAYLMVDTYPAASATLTP